MFNERQANVLWIRSVLFFLIGVSTLNGCQVVENPKVRQVGIWMANPEHQKEVRTFLTQAGATAVIANFTAELRDKLLHECPKHYICKDKNLLLDDGYTINRNDPKHPEWTPGMSIHDHANVFSAVTEGKWVPENGYVWSSGGGRTERTVQENLNVQWSPGISHPFLPHITADNLEHYWHSEPGYAFISKSSLQVCREPGSPSPFPSNSWKALLDTPTCNTQVGSNP